MAKKVGSNFFLMNRRLSVNLNFAFAALSAEGGAASAAPNYLAISKIVSRGEYEPPDGGTENACNKHGPPAHAVGQGTDNGRTEERTERVDGKEGRNEHRGARKPNHVKREDGDHNPHADDIDKYGHQYERLGLKHSAIYRE